MKIDNPPHPPLEKGGEGDLEAIFHVNQITKAQNSKLFAFLEFEHLNL